MQQDTPDKPVRTVVAAPIFNNIPICGKCFTRLDAQGKCLCSLSAKPVMSSNKDKTPEKK